MADNDGRHDPRVAASPLGSAISAWSDHYFVRTRDIVRRFGDQVVTYAVFMRRPVIFTPRLAVAWLGRVAEERGTSFGIELNYQEGDWIGAGEPMMFITGPFSHLAELETLLLQKIGPPCVAAYNAYSMCIDLPRVAFLAMDARHCAGTDMAELMAYGCWVGSEAAKHAAGATGFVGNATSATCHWFGLAHGMGTMPHALVGYAGSTLRAAEMYLETYPDEPLTVLPDYFGREVSDTLDVCRRFPDMAADGRIAVRIDTHGGRYIEGLDMQGSYAVLERHVPLAVRRYRTEAELKVLVGTGVSAAAIFHMRECLDAAGFTAVRIVASSGFTVEKCKVMADVGAPIDVIGTGSYLPDRWSETAATADIVAYDGRPSVKVGREFLLRRPSSS